MSRQMWLADLVTAVIGVLFLTAPFSPQFNSSRAATWTYMVCGALFLLLGVLTLNWDEYRHPWYLHVAAFIVGAWFVLPPFWLRPAGRVVDDWPLIAGGGIIIVLNAWMAARQLPRHMPAH